MKEGKLKSGQPKIPEESASEWASTDFRQQQVRGLIYQAASGSAVRHLDVHPISDKRCSKMDTDKWIGALGTNYVIRGS